MPSVREIEQAIKNTIEESPIGPAIKTISGYQDALRAISNDGEEAGPFPGVFVVYTGGDFTRPANKIHRHVALWRILVVVQDFASETGRTEQGVGAYDLVDSLLLLLSENTLGLENLEQGLRPTGIQGLPSEKLIARGINVYAIDFNCKYLIETRHEDYVKALKAIGITWYIQPEHEVGGDVKDYQALIDLTD